MESAALTPDAASPTAPSPTLPRSLQALRWRAGIVQIASRLIYARQPEITGQVTDLLHNESLTEAEVLALLRPMIKAVLRDAATVLADGIGAKSDELLHFAHPGCAEVELAGTRASLRRLDRILGGTALIFMEGIGIVRMFWPGPCVGYLTALRHPVQVHGKPAPLGMLVHARPGTELQMGAEAVLAIRHLPVVDLFGACHAAGMDTHSLLNELVSRAIIETPLGPLTLDGKIATLQGRKIRISSSESILLRKLGSNPGQPFTRDELAAAINLDSPRALDRIMVALRDKLGDGILTTIYGIGYAIELKS